MNQTILGFFVFMVFFSSFVYAVPTVTIASPTNTTYDTTSIDLNVSADETINTWNYSLNGGTNTTFTPNTTITGVEGSNNVIVYANSSGGDVGFTTQYFTVDTTAPTITIDSPTNTTYNYTSIDLNVSADETIDTWYYSLNGGTNTTFTPNTTITGVEGSNNVIVYANDSVGNVGEETVYFTYVVLITFDSFDYVPTPPNEIQDVAVSTTFSASPTTVILELYGSTNYTVTDAVLLEYTLNITSGNYTAHDLVTWKWYAVNLNGDVFISSEQNFTVANRLPSVTAPYIDNTAPDNDDIVMCLGGIFSDPDTEDVEDSRDFAWFMDEVQIEGEYTSMLDIGTISHEGEEVITCKLRVNDSYGVSSWVESSNFATLMFTAGFYEQHQASYISGDLDDVVIDIVATAGASTIPYVPIIVIFFVMAFVFRSLFFTRL